MKVSPGTVVEVDGKKGVVCNDPYGCINYAIETPILFENSTAFVGVNNKKIKILKPGPILIENPNQCGIGSENACVFLLAGGGYSTFICARGTRHHQTCLDSCKHANRIPEEFYPDCQLSQ